tara:strand:+ start:145 stop:450 length:306 start_codon:yes stop_codon:yes gene_type:complete
MMTKKQMEELADMVSAKIILELFGDKEARANAMEQFQEEKFESNIGSVFSDLTDEELLIGELARLQTILMIYEGQDTRAGYLKAAKILKKLRLIQKKLGDQ